MLAILVVGACAALPWAVPRLPDALAGVLPAGSTSAPPRAAPSSVAPAADYISNPVGAVLADRRPPGPVGRPLAIRVPRLGVSSSVVPIGLDDDALVPPSDPSVIGWWDGGARAGARTGTTVLTGHTVHAGGGAFDELGELGPGDAVRVRTRRGWVSYQVSEVQDLPVRTVARRSAELFRQDGPGRLVLVTCTDFDGTSYLANTVVVAVPVVGPVPGAAGGNGSTTTP